jgi:hypothetical protein
MELEIEGDSVTLRRSQDEAVRLGVAITAGYEAVSRAEYFIRTGAFRTRDAPDRSGLMRMPCQPAHRQSIPVEAGVEEIENPRRPTPPR